MEVVERVIGMLKSPDEGTVRLGATLALGMGPEWCLETFKQLTMNAEENIKKRHNFPIIKSHPKLRGEKYIKDGVMIYFGDYIQCDYWYRRVEESRYSIFAGMRYSGKITILDKEEE